MSMYIYIYCLVAQYTYIYMYICMYIHTHLHTHMHMYKHILSLIFPMISAEHALSSLFTTKEREGLQRLSNLSMFI